MTPTLDATTDSRTRFHAWNLRMWMVWESFFEAFSGALLCDLFGAQGGGARGARKPPIRPRAQQTSRLITAKHRNRRTGPPPYSTTTDISSHDNDTTTTGISPSPPLLWELTSIVQTTDRGW